MNGSWALIAGGSQGIGLAFARQLADRGHDLVLVAHDEVSLRSATDELADRVHVLPVLQDLTVDGALQKVADAVADRQVDVLVANAALSPIGEFLDMPEDVLGRAITLNVDVATRLVHRYAGPMRARGQGTVILLSSLSGLQGTALLTTYAATKAYLRVLAEGLWEELAPHGVQVVGVLPGTTDTPGFQSSQPRGGPAPMPPETVAATVLASLDKGPLVVPGLLNKVTAFVTTRLLPRRGAVRLISRETRKMYRDTTRT